jgi:hypothetical protein
VGGNHHYLVPLQSKQVDRHLVGTGIGLIGLDQFRRENAIPRQSAILRHVHQQGYVAVRQSGQDKVFAQVRKPWNGVRPGLQSVPHTVEMVFLGLCHAVGNRELEQQLVQGQTV